MEGYITIIDFILLPFYLLIIYFVAIRIQNKNIDDTPCYKYYVKGLFAKLAISIIFCCIYVFYYQGGDTTGYFNSSVSLGKIFFKNPAYYFDMMRGNLSMENYTIFDFDTNAPGYYRDSQSFAVVRFVSPITIITFNSYILSTILLSWIAYSGIWRL